jgi:protein TonB
METYTAAGDYLLLKQRSRDALGTLWRAGELERAGFKRIVWLRRFDGEGLDRAALGAAAPVVQQLSEMLKAINVARNATFSTADGVPCLAFDYVPGPPLDELLTRLAREQFPMAIDNALLVAEKLAAALCAALALELRGEPLLHGFLVPQLVILGNDGEAIVAGFGLDQGLLANLDRPAVRELAAPYLAPEVLATHAASRRSDVYSLGAILYHLLCGAPLPADVKQRGAALTAPQLAFEEGPLPEDLASVLRRCLAERPEDRYSSAVDFKRDLEKLLYGGAYAPTTFNLALFMDRLYRQEIEQEDRDLQREKTIDVTPYFKPPKATVEAPATAARSSRTSLLVGAGAVIVLLAVAGYLLFGRPAPQPQQPAATTQNVADLIQSEVAKQLAEKESQLQDELNREKQETEKLRAQLTEQQKKSAAAASADARKDQKSDLQREIAAREEEQRRHEDELKKLQEQRAKAETAAAKQVVAPAGATPPEAGGSTVPPPATAPKVGLTPVPQRTAPAVPQPTVAALATSTPGSVATEETAAPVEGPVDAARLDVPPRLLVETPPSYPSLARRARVEGVVTLGCTIDQTGKVKDVKVLHGLPMGLTEAAVDAVKQWRYAPSTLHGAPVEVAITVNVTFRLR